MKVKVSIADGAKTTELGKLKIKVLFVLPDEPNVLYSRGTMWHPGSVDVNQLTDQFEYIDDTRTMPSDTLVFAASKVKVTLG